MSRTVRIATACLLGLVLGAFATLIQTQPWLQNHIIRSL